jgi:hypothetical protein
LIDTIQRHAGGLYCSSTKNAVVEATNNYKKSPVVALHTDPGGVRAPVIGRYKGQDYLENGVFACACCYYSTLALFQQATSMPMLV